MVSAASVHDITGRPLGGVRVVCWASACLMFPLPLCRVFSRLWCAPRCIYGFQQLHRLFIWGLLQCDMCSWIRRQSRGNLCFRRILAVFGLLYGRCVPCICTRAMRPLYRDVHLQPLTFVCRRRAEDDLLHVATSLLTAGSLRARSMAHRWDRGLVEKRRRCLHNHGMGDGVFKLGLVPGEYWAQDSRSRILFDMSRCGPPVLLIGVLRHLPLRLSFSGTLIYVSSKFLCSSFFVCRMWVGLVKVCRFSRTTCLLSTAADSPGTSSLQKKKNQPLIGSGRQ